MPQREAEADPGEDPPRADQQPAADRTARAVGDRGVEGFGVPAAGPVPVGDQAGDRGDDPERQEDVEQRDPGHHEVQAVDGEQQTRDGADQGRPGHPAYRPDHQQHGQGAEQGRHEPPAERVHPEQLLTGGDHPLADLGVHGQARGGLEDVQVAAQDRLVGGSLRLVDELPRVPELEQAERVLGVVRLVEDELHRVAEVPEPQDRGHRGDRQRRDPAAVEVLRHRRVQPLLQRRQPSPEHVPPERLQPVGSVTPPRSPVLDHSSHARHGTDAPVPPPPRGCGKPEPAASNLLQSVT